MSIDDRFREHLLLVRIGKAAGREKFQRHEIRKVGDLRLTPGIPEQV
jgi:hypothetical protein